MISLFFVSQFDFKFILTHKGQMYIKTQKHTLFIFLILIISALLGKDVEVNIKAVILEKRQVS